MAFSGFFLFIIREMKRASLAIRAAKLPNPLQASLGHRINRRWRRVGYVVHTRERPTTPSPPFFDTTPPAILPRVYIPRRAERAYIKGIPFARYMNDDKKKHSQPGSRYIFFVPTMGIGLYLPRTTPFFTSGERKRFVWWDGRTKINSLPSGELISCGFVIKKLSFLKKLFEPRSRAR